MRAGDAQDSRERALAGKRSLAEDVKVAITGMPRLPTLPEVATRALTLANDASASLKDFAALIERDPILATGILKLANSALFHIGHEIASLNQAVLRLGLRECKNLLIAVSVRSLFRGIRVNREYCESLWEHSFLTACVCLHLSRALECGHQGEEFSCGLCHDIGHILMAVAVPQLLEPANLIDYQEAPDVLEREQEQLGTDHCSLGAWYASGNKLPAAVVSVIQFHHSPSQATAHPLLVGLVATADQLANHWQQNKQIDSYDIRTSAGWATLAQHYNGERLEKVRALIPALVAEATREASKSSLFAA